MQSTAAKTKKLQVQAKCHVVLTTVMGCNQRPEEASTRVSSVMHVNSVGPVYNSDEVQHI